MKKTFKKPLALALAVLMLLTSIPFSALALPGDYSPNIKLLFGTAGNMITNQKMVGEGAYYVPTGVKNTDALDNIGFIGLYGAPLDFNYTKSGDKSTGETVSGKLSLSPSKAQAYIDFLNDPSGNDLGASNITSKTTLGVGDYFVVTVVAENVKSVKNLDARFEYSANIEPAGIYGSGTNTKKNYQYKTLSEVTSNDKHEGQNAAEPLSGQCSDAFYATVNETGDNSEFDTVTRRILAEAVGTPDATDVSSTPAPAGQSFFDQTTGAAIAALPADTMVLESYMFKIVGDGDISFTMLPNTKGDFSNGLYIANAADGDTPDFYTTYSPNGTNPGSEKMTFMASKAPAPVACYDITVKSGFTNGTVTMDGVTVDPATGATKKVEVNTKVKLVATPAEGAKFLGWVANDGTTVPTDATLDGTFEAFVNANVTYTPVFAKASEGQIVLTFVDAFENIVDFKVITKGTTPDSIPAVPARAGYTNGRWSVTDFTTLNKDTVVTAIYDKDTTDTFTVTAEGCQITVGTEAPVNDVATGIKYNTQVTVSNPSAKSWKINGATVAYGNTYTFYVGSDVNLTANTTETVTSATPVVGAVDKNVVGDRVSFVATLTIGEGYERVNAGFIYGKNTVNINTELVDVRDAAGIKAVYTKTDSAQFSISFTASTPGVVYGARAFLTYKDGTNYQVVYGNLQSHEKSA